MCVYVYMYNGQTETAGEGRERMGKWKGWKCSDWLREDESKWGLIKEDMDRAFRSLQVLQALDSPLGTSLLSIWPLFVTAVHSVSLTYFVHTHFSVSKKLAFLKFWFFFSSSNFPLLYSTGEERLKAFLPWYLNINGFRDNPLLDFFLWH